MRDLTPEIVRRSRAKGPFLSRPYRAPRPSLRERLGDWLAYAPALAAVLWAKLRSLALTRKG